MDFVGWSVYFCLVRPFNSVVNFFNFPNKIYYVSDGIIFTGLFLEINLQNDKTNASIDKSLLQAQNELSLQKNT